MSTMDTKAHVEKAKLDMQGFLNKYRKPGTERNADVEPKQPSDTTASQQRTVQYSQGPSTFDSHPSTKTDESLGDVSKGWSEMQAGENLSKQLDIELGNTDDLVHAVQATKITRSLENQGVRHDRASARDVTPTTSESPSKRPIGVNNKTHNVNLQRLHHEDLTKLASIDNFKLETDQLTSNVGEIVVQSDTTMQAKKPKKKPAKVVEKPNLPSFYRFIQGVDTEEVKVDPIAHMQEQAKKQKAIAGQKPLASPDPHDTPKHGDPRLPIIKLNALPPPESLNKQIEKTLPGLFKTLPSPVYKYSKKKQQAKKQYHPKRAALNPPREFEMLIMGQVMAPEKAHVQQATLSRPRREGQPKVDLVQELAAGEIPGIGPVRVNDGESDNRSKALRAMSTFSPRLPLETQESVSRWLWFAKPDESTVGSVRASENVRLELVGWDGNFLPPPLDWECRDQFQLDKRSIRRIEAWLEYRVENQLRRPYNVDTTEEGFRSGDIPASGVRFHWQEFPPDSWYDPVPIGYGPINWKDIPERKPDDEYSLAEGRLEQTANKRCKVHWAEKVKEGREKHAANEIARKAERKALKKERRRASGDAERLDWDSSKALVKLNPWTPRANIYIRRARAQDIAQITEIYNEYVPTIHANDISLVDVRALTDRLRNAETDRLPFLVSVLKSHRTDKNTRNNRVPQRGRRGRGRPSFDRRLNEGQVQSTNDVIVGFTVAMPWGGHGSCFQNVVEQLIFVDTQYQRNGIGKNLLDRAISCMDPSNECRRGTDIVVDEEQGSIWTNGYKDARKIIINLYYRDFDEAELQGRKKFLEDVFHFHVGGNHVNMCQKQKDEQFSMLVMERDCGLPSYCYD